MFTWPFLSAELINAPLLIWISSRLQNLLFNDPLRLTEKSTATKNILVCYLWLFVCMSNNRNIRSRCTADISKHNFIFAQLYLCWCCKPSRQHLSFSCRSSHLSTLGFVSAFFSSRVFALHYFVCSFSRSATCFYSLRSGILSQFNIENLPSLKKVKTVPWKVNFNLETNRCAEKVRNFVDLSVKFKVCCSQLLSED